MLGGEVMVLGEREREYVRDKEGLNGRKIMLLSGMW